MSWTHAFLKPEIIQSHRAHAAVIIHRAMQLSAGFCRTQDCSGLDVSGTTDTGVSYGTEAAGGLALVYPLVSDNSDCYLQQNPSYCATAAT